jgi:hypothetical protein
LPVPIAAKPMLVLSFVQLYTQGPAGKFIGFVFAPLDTTCWACALLREKKKNSNADKISEYFFM